MKTKVTLKRFNIQLDGKNYNVFSIVKLSVIIFFSLMFLSCTKYIDDFSVFDFMNIADTVFDG